VHRRLYLDIFSREARIWALYLFDEWVVAVCHGHGRGPACDTNATWPKHRLSASLIIASRVDE
jgi:hypothetical protein